MFNSRNMGPTAIGTIFECEKQHTAHKKRDIVKNKYRTPAISAAVLYRICVIYSKTPATMPSAYKITRPCVHSIALKIASSLPSVSFCLIEKRTQP